MHDEFHIPVLSHEAVNQVINTGLKRQIIVDGTLGGGGYTKLLCENTGSGDLIISIDKDLHSLEHAKKFLEAYKSRIIFINGNFGEIKNILKEININKITGLVLDLGLSSYQLEAESGFSFMRDTSLDMRADKSDTITAGSILNSYHRDELEELFENYGEIGNAKRLAKAITERRKTVKFETTFQLVELIKDEYQISKKNMIDFLAKIFQALRIAVNKELENLEAVLNDSLEFIETGGRIAVVSYHSLEDRIVKNFFKDKSSKIEKSDDPYGGKPIDPKMKVLTKKPIVPSHEEIKFNNRARSAKLRAAEIL